MSQKKPKCLTLREKALIIQELKSGSSLTKLSKKYDIAKSTICKIKNQQELILRAVTSTYQGLAKRTLKGSKQPEMEKKLYQWVLDKRNKNVVISGEMIKEKAKELHSDIKQNANDKFSASDGWLQRFKRRFGIWNLKITGEQFSSLPELIDPFKMEFKNKIEQLGITLDELHNADGSHGNLNTLLPQIEFIDIDVIKSNTVVSQMENIDEDRDKEGIKTEASEENIRMKITPDSAINALNTSIQWAEETGFDYNYIQLLKDMRETAVMQKVNKLK